MSRRYAAALLAVTLAGLAGCAQTTRPPGQVPGGDAERGRTLIAHYGCASCHTVPGVRGADGLVGPPLTSFGERSYIAGELVNNGQNLQRWIRDPQSVEPGTAMPKLGVTAEDARDIAAYLLSLE
ncbi:cytochrome c [Nonomuraea pusilla]|uniref:c-type cytochrome n=1 Tax=Nonomuraea pusilla TaxID=46177 RepID=UPI0033266F4C